MWMWSKGPPMPIVRRRPPPKTAWSAQKVADRRTLGRLVPGNDDKRWPIGKVLANTFRKDEGQKILRTHKALKWKLAPLTSKPASKMHQKIMSLWGQKDISAFPFCIFNVIRCPKYTGQGTQNFGFTQNIGHYPLFQVTCYPMNFQTESGWVGYWQKYRVAGRVWVPVGHCRVKVFLGS